MPLLFFYYLVTLHIFFSKDAMLAANAFDSQLEIDLDMIHADERADSG